MRLPLFRPARPAAPRGPRPAAGLLLTHVDRHGVAWILLGKRCRQLGGTWANIGGSLDPGEAPLVGALREFHEELNVPAAALVGSMIMQVIESGTAEKPYSLFVLDCPVVIDDAELGWENDDLAWFRADEVDRLARKGRLHPRFALAWTYLKGTAA